MSSVAPVLSPCWQAHYLSAATWEEIEALRLKTDWPHTAVLPEMRAEPEHNAVLYRQVVEVAQAGEDEEDELCVGSAMLATRVWVNGVLIAEHWGGYTPFAVGVSRHLKPGENEIVLGVRGEDATFFAGGRAARCAIGVSGLMLDGPGKARWREQFGLAAPCARFGVTAEVRLSRRPRRGVSDVFVYANTELTTLEIEITHDLIGDSNWELTILERDGRCVETRRFSAGQLLQPHTTNRLNHDQRCQRICWETPGLLPWSPEHPQLYWLDVRAIGEPSDEGHRVRFGWRSFVIQGGDFYLNGIKTVLRGESDLFQNQGFQFYGPHGQDIAALRDEGALREYLTAMKRDLGINAFRQHAAIGCSEVFSVADEVGLLVLNQSSVWSRGYSYYRAAGEAFIEQATEEFSAWVRRDRNHPSVVIWGVENEMLRIGSEDTEACAFFRRLADPIGALDPSRPHTFDGGAAVMRSGQFYHIHHEENYDVILRGWAHNVPLVLGEFWIGGRNAERRLTNAREFASGPEFQSEMNRLWARKIIGARLAGASGIMPYNFSAQILGARLRRQGRRSSRKDWTDSWLGPSGLEIDAASRSLFRHALGPFLVAVDTHRQAFYVDDVREVTLPVMVRNDSETPKDLALQWWLDGESQGAATLRLEPGESRRQEIAIKPAARCAAVVRISLVAGGLGQVDQTEKRLHFSRREKATSQLLKRRIFQLSDKAVEPYVRELQSRQIKVEEWTARTPIEEMEGAIFIASPAAIPELLRVAGGAEVRGFVVEGEGTFPGWLGTGGIYDLRQPYLHSNHFASIIGRELELNDLYHPNEAMVEDPDHPALARWPTERFTGFDDTEGDVLTRGMIVLPGMTLGNIMGDMKNVGAGMTLGEEDVADTVVASGVSCRPLLSSSRREYASLAEVTVGNSRWLVNRLRLGDALGSHPWADALWRDGLGWLDDAPAIETDDMDDLADLSPCDASEGEDALARWTDESTVVVHNLAKASEAFMVNLSRRIGLIKRVKPTVRPNHLAVEHGGFFAGSKSASILQAPLPFESALAWDDASAVVGGWRLLHCDQSFEVTGHAFPWAWRSDYPKLAGFAALHLHCHGRDWLLLLDNITSSDSSVRERYRVVLDNVRRMSWSSR